MARVQQQFNDDGFAIWITGSDTKYESDIHINEWINPSINHFK